MSTEAHDWKPTQPSIDAIRGQLAVDIGGLLAAAQRAYRLRAGLLWSAAMLVVLMMLAGMDLWLRREELGLRVLFFLTWFMAAIGAALYWIAPAWRFAPSRVELARWIERAQPELGERLSTAVELAESSTANDRLGSVQFREAALRGWSAWASRVPWRSYLNHSSWLKPGSLLALILVVALAITAWRPAEMRLAIKRLFTPWANLPWPLQDQLQFVDVPKVVAQGQELNLEIIDLKAPMPFAIEVQVRYPNSTAPQDAITYFAKNLADVAVASIPSVDQPIELRAIGGDDQGMAWHRIDVAQPPKLEAYRFKIQPPTYSGRPDSEIVGNRLRVLAGSRLQFIGRFAEPVLNIEAAMQSQPNSGGDPSIDVTALGLVDLRAGGRDFEWQVCNENTELGVRTWRWKVTAKSELMIESPEIWSVEVVADAVPIVTLAEQELSQFSPDAAVLIQGHVNDDLGLLEVSLRWQFEDADDDEPGTMLLWKLDEESEMEQREFVVDRTWDLDSSVGLLAGKRLRMWLEARDTLGQVGKSTPQLLEVRDAADVLESIAARQLQLLEQVRAITEAQRRNSQLASRSREIVDQSAAVRREEVDALVNVAQMQQSVNRQIGAERNSVAEGLRTLTKLLDNNQLSEAEMAQQIKSLSKRLESISLNEMAQALSAAQRAVELAKEPTSTNEKLSSGLAEALIASEVSQREALAELQGLTDRLAQSEALRVVERELGQVLNQQQVLRGDTDNLELRRLSGMNKEDFQANRAGLQSDQLGLAQSIEQLHKRAKDLVAALPEDQHSLKVQVNQALDRLTKDQVSGQMRAATQSIANDRFVEAAETQAAVVSSLQEALQKLNASSSRNLEGQLGQMKSTASELNDLAGVQSELAKRLASPDAARQMTALVAEQQQLQLQTEVQRAEADEAGDSQTEQALSAATDSQQAVAKSAGLGQNSEAAKQARVASQQLAEAAKNSSQRAEELEQELAEQQLMQLGTDLERLVSQQQPLVEKLFAAAQVHLDDLDDAARQAAEQDIRQLASRQEAVRQAVRDVRTHIDKLPAFGWTLEQAELDMARAVAATERCRVAPEATNSATRALGKLEQAANALKRPDQASQNPENTEQSPATDAKATKRPVPPLASLRLLRGLQWEVIEETKQFSDAGPTIGADRVQRLEQLSQQQAELGQQLDQILRELASATESQR